MSVWVIVIPTLGYGDCKTVIHWYTDCNINPWIISALLQAGWLIHAVTDTERRKPDTGYNQESRQHWYHILIKAKFTAYNSSTQPISAYQWCFALLHNCIWHFCTLFGISADLCLTFLHTCVWHFCTLVFPANPALLCQYSGLCQAAMVLAAKKRKKDSLPHIPSHTRLIILNEPEWLKFFVTSSLPPTHTETTPSHINIDPHWPDTGIFTTTGACCSSFKRDFVCVWISKNIAVSKAHKFRFKSLICCLLMIPQSTNKPKRLLYSHNTNSASQFEIIVFASENMRLLHARGPTCFIW